MDCPHLLRAALHGASPPISEILAYDEVEMCNSVVFNTVTELCGHHQYPVPEHVFIPKETWCPLAVTPRPPSPQDLDSTSCLRGFPRPAQFTSVECQCVPVRLASFCECSVVPGCPRRGVSQHLIPSYARVVVPSGRGPHLCVRSCVRGLSPPFQCRESCCSEHHTHTSFYVPVCFSFS